MFVNYVVYVTSEIGGGGCYGVTLLMCKPSRPGWCVCRRSCQAEQLCIGRMGYITPFLTPRKADRVG